MEGNEHLLHLATLEKGLRIFCLMLCIAGEHKNKAYIEEYVINSIDYSKDVYGHYKFIEDDELAEELARFCEEKKLSDISVRASEMIECGLGKIIFR